jgi:hypothetical protein
MARLKAPNEIISLCLFIGMHNEWVFTRFYVCVVIGLCVFWLVKLLTDSKFCPCLAVKITTYLCQHLSYLVNDYYK